MVISNFSGKYSLLERCYICVKKQDNEYVGWLQNTVLGMQIHLLLNMFVNISIHCSKWLYPIFQGNIRYIYKTNKIVIRKLVKHGRLEFFDVSCGS